MHLVPKCKDSYELAGVSGRPRRGTHGVKSRGF
jgi:hypothetical protein